MGFVAELAEHGDRFVVVMWFAEHVSFEPNDGVGCDEELVGKEMGLVRACLRARDIIRNIACLKFRREGFVGFDVNSSKWEV